MLQPVRRVGEALARRPLLAARPMAILFEKSLEHLTLSLAAMWVGVPTVPVLPGYALLSTKFAKLRHVLTTVTSGLVFATDARFRTANTAVAAADAEAVLVKGALTGRTTTPL